MKILILLPGYHNGGTCTALRCLLPLFYRHGHMVDVFGITGDGPNKEYFSKFANILEFNGSKNMASSSKKTFKQYVAGLVKSLKKLLCLVGFDISSLVFKHLAKGLEKKHYDLVISFQEGQATLFGSFFNHTPVISWVHCDYEDYCKKNKNYKKEEKYYEKFKSVVCVSDYTRANFEKYIHSAKKVHALHNILDSDIIIERSKEPIDDRNFDTNTFTIVSIGRINEVKRFSCIPEIAMKIVASGTDAFKWYIIGDGDETEKKILYDNILKHSAQNHVIAIGNKNNPYPYLAHANLFVSTSRSEACPYVINEAKILHVPIVSANYGSIYEFIEDGVNGLISPIEDIDVKIAQMINDKDLYCKIADTIKDFKYDNSPIEKKLFDEILV